MEKTKEEQIRDEESGFIEEAREESIAFDLRND